MELNFIVLKDAMNQHLEKMIANATRLKQTFLFFLVINEIGVK
jgi:hypothetical protein